MMLSLAITIVLVLATFGFHFWVLRSLSTTLPDLRFGLEIRILVVVVTMFMAHLIETIAYGVGYWLAALWSLGALVGSVDGNVLDYFYFSLVSYTSLGLGDVTPTGHLRLLTGIEALNGLFLITWSASYTYLAMGRLWPWRACN